MIVDVTGTVLLPGNQGKDCLGNGSNPSIECCCDECEYIQCTALQGNAPSVFAVKLRDS